MMMKAVKLSTVLFMCVWTPSLLCMDSPADCICTFSIVAYDPAVKEWGVAVQSKFLAVGSVVPFAEAGTGALASQAWGNTTYGPQGLTLLRMGIPADEVVRILVEKDPDRGYRQLGVVDRQGRASTFTGDLCQEWAGHRTGNYYCVQGNILAGEDVINGMAEAFENTTGALAVRLISALKGGQAKGGDSRGMESAALLITREKGGYSGFDDRAIDLRVDHHDSPIEELQKLYLLHQKTFLAMSYMQTFSAALEAGDHPRADQLMAYSLEIAETNSTEGLIYNDVAWFMALNNYKLDQALHYARCAVEKNPDNANAWDTLAEVYSRTNDFKKAVEASQKALELSRNSPDFAGRLAHFKEMSLPIPVTNETKVPISTGK